MSASSTISSSENQAETIERALAVEILRGERPAHSQLPPLRDLAATWSVTVPTIQRVVDRLAAKGLVVVRRGSGVRVSEAPASVDLTLLPLWFEALCDQPERASKILSELLEMRRIVLEHLLRTRWTAIDVHSPSLAKMAAELVQANSTSDLAEADLRFSGALVEASGHFAAQAIFHASASIVREVPLVMEAIYRDRGAYRRTVVRMLKALQDSESGAPEVDAISTALKNWDKRTVKKFLSLAMAATGP